jgi:dTDP-4-dehydrorhamnose reductase
MKILIAGGTGMLGSRCAKVLESEHEVVCPDREQLDIISWDRVIELFDQISPDAVINCAGLTDVAACEDLDDFVIKKSNVEGPRNMAQASARFGCKMVHISCVHVFDGQKSVPQPYFEDDSLNPLSAYGTSKLESETAIRGNSPNYIIIRSAWLYDVYGKNFLKTMLSEILEAGSGDISFPDDHFGSPTWCYPLALQIKELLVEGGRGTYHATTEGYCSRFELAEYLVSSLRLDAHISPCSLKDMKTVKRPANALLENRLAKNQGRNIMGGWKENLDRFLDEFGQTLLNEATG